MHVLLPKAQLIIVPQTELTDRLASCYILVLMYANMKRSHNEVFLNPSIYVLKWHIMYMLCL